MKRFIDHVYECTCIVPYNHQKKYNMGKRERDRDGETCVKCMIMISIKYYVPNNFAK